MTERRYSGRRKERGLSMVELMVGLLIALIGSIVIFQVFVVSENYKRTTTGSSDAIQSANFSLHQLERYFSGAGAGFARMSNMWGCLVQAHLRDYAVDEIRCLGTVLRVRRVLDRRGVQRHQAKDPDREDQDRDHPFEQGSAAFEAASDAAGAVSGVHRLSS